MSSRFFQSVTRSVLFFCLVLIFGAISPQYLKTGETSLNIYDRKILVIQSYNRDYVHTRALEEGIVKVFKNSSENIRINYEFLDTKKYFTSEYFHSLFLILYHLQLLLSILHLLTYLKQIQELELNLLLHLF